MVRATGSRRIEVKPQPRISFVGEWYIATAPFEGGIGTHVINVLDESIEVTMTGFRTHQEALEWAIGWIEVKEAKEEEEEKG